MTSFISNRFDQFRYFDAQLGHPSWAGKHVLDFGGNVGNLLLDPDCAIEHDKYWCIDVSKDAIEQGQHRHQGANFRFYDRYNFEFNPGGIKGLPIPDVGPRFDVIIAWSVFTHTGKAEMLELVGQLEALLSDDGVLAFTFLDPYFDPPEPWVRETESPGLDNLRWRIEARRKLNPAVDVEGLAAAASAEPMTWVALLNDDKLVLDPDDDGIEQEEDQRYYITLCSEDYMRSIYPRGEILSPIRPERQSCCVIRKRPA